MSQSQSKPLKIIHESTHPDPRMGRSVLYEVPPNKHGVFAFHALGNGPDFTERDLKKFLDGPHFKAMDEKMRAELAKPVLIDEAEWAH